jgi:hypothetical protein
MRYRVTLSHDIAGSEEIDDPKGWDAIEVITKRDPTYIGMFFDFTVKLDFYCSGGGKEFVDEVYDTYGIDAVITILIEVDCNESGIYEEFYTGALDLETYERKYTQPEYTTVAINQQGPIDIIKSRLETNVDLTKLVTIDGTSLTDFTYGPYDLHLHSKEIITSSQFSSDAGAYAEGSIYSLTAFGYTYLTIPFIYPISFIEQEYVQSYTNFFSDNITIDNPDSLFTAIADGVYGIDYKLKGSFTETYATDEEREYGLAIEYRVGVSRTILFDWGRVAVSGGTQTFAYDLSGSFNVNILNGDTISFYFVVTQYFPSITQDYVLFTQSLDPEGYIRFSQNSTTADSTCKAFAIHEAFARVCQSITDSTDPFRSNFFGRVNSEPNPYDSNGCGSFAAITNGFQIRQFPLNLRPPFISLKQLFNSCNAIYNLGMGIEESGGNFYIRVEPKEYFFSQTVLLQIPNIKGLKKTIAREYYFNNFTCGYNNWQQDGTQGINGLDEVNTKRSYVLGLKKISNSLTQLCDLVAAPYVLERTRRKPYDTFASTNYQYDDKNFIICLNRDVNGLGEPENLITAEKDENYPHTQKILSPATIYNLRISPGRIFRSWLKWLTPSIVKNNDVLKDIKFSYGEGNYTMISQGTDACDGMDYIDESTDIEALVPNATASCNPLFIPEVVDFVAPLSLADYKLIKANPTQCIEISTTETDFIKAFIIQIKYNPSRGMATFSMLLSNDSTNYCSHIYVEDGYVECGYVE